MAPTTEELILELTLCCQNAMAAYNAWRTLENAQYIQSYWNFRARATRQLLEAEDFDKVEETVGWRTNGGRGYGAPILRK